MSSSKRMFNNNNSNSSNSNSDIRSLYDVIHLVIKNGDKDSVESCFEDFRYCKMHNKIVARFVLSNVKEGEDARDKECNKCPSAMFSKEFDVESLLQKPAGSISSAKAKWEQVRVALSETKNDIPVILRERETWFEYLQACYEEGCKRRNNIINAIREANHANQPTIKNCPMFQINDLMGYNKSLLSFYESFQQRVSENTKINILTQQNKKMICQQYCEQHQTLGDLIPYRPAYFYQECGMCAKPKKANQKKQQAVRELEDQLFAYKGNNSNNNNNKGGSSKRESDAMNED